MKNLIVVIVLVLLSTGAIAYFSYQAGKGNQKVVMSFEWLPLTVTAPVIHGQFTASGHPSLPVKHDTVIIHDTVSTTLQGGEDSFIAEYEDSVITLTMTAFPQRFFIQGDYTIKKRIFTDSIAHIDSTMYISTSSGTVEWYWVPVVGIIAYLMGRI